jgi:hypothetical protein
MLLDGKGFSFETFYKRGRFEEIPLSTQVLLIAGDRPTEPKEAKGRN